MNIQDIKPMHDRIIVKQTDSLLPKYGIIAPVEDHDIPYKGEVVAVGDGFHGKPMQVKLGDIVRFKLFDGEPLDVNDEEYLIMRESDIIGIER